ncbi:hypothetical protein [Umezawaea sp. Da 62-37]|uniref:hypothetical protein n=1 Tax=Umezawaea sp. Da 62-37 TaxID=3075927 RepID=UPI0028F72FE1|nr:hypothetical protein [Umezawaea sp. Da 62-37]WNV91625.1 hypothetical protein RM788_26215 [Umezawaea sp. Da 62-37]
MELPPAWQRPDPLRGLEAVPWNDLSDGRGTARGVGELLRRVTDEDADVRSTALDGLVARLLPEDTVSEASAFAVPFLAELGANYKVAPDARDRVIFLLASMALAGCGFTEDGKRTWRRWNAVGRELPRLPPDWITRTRCAVAKAAPKVFESLSNAEVACVVALATAVPEVVPTQTAHVVWGIAHGTSHHASAALVDAAAVAHHLVQGLESDHWALLNTAQDHPDLLRDYEDDGFPPHQPGALTMALMGYRLAFRAAYGEESAEGQPG